MFYKLLARLIVLLTSIPIHETAHAYAAYKMGDETALQRGRVSLNPLDHIDPIGALMILFTGIGWAKPVSVNSYYFRDRKKGMIITALAGPLSNIALAGVSMIIYKLMRYVFFFLPLGGLGNGVLQVLSIMVSANISLAVFNLIPLPPLDGWKVFSNLMPTKIQWQIMQYEQQISMFLIFAVLLGLLNLPIGIISNVIFVALDKLTFFVDLIMGLLL